METEIPTRQAVAQVIAVATAIHPAPAQPPDIPARADRVTATGLLGMALKLALVLALAYGASLILRRLGPRWRSRPASGEGLAVVGVLALGQGRVIYVVAVGERRLLIGATPQQLALLGDVTADLAESAGLGDSALQGEG